MRSTHAPLLVAVRAIVVAVASCAALSGAPSIAAAAGAGAGAAHGAGGFDHGAWDGLLGKYVRRGAVAYKKWHGASASRGTLDGYLESLATADPKAIPGRDERMAFWINAYNACVIDMVLDRYPLKSVMDVPDFFKIKVCKVAGEIRSLDGIEKGVLRRQPFGDPRLHFALNCASKSCPPLLSKAWTGKGMSRALDKAAKGFITQGGGARVEGGKLHISKLFEWYADDFKKSAPTSHAYIGKYLPAAGDESLPVAYDEYDWSLNGN